MYFSAVDKKIDTLLPTVPVKKMCNTKHRDKFQSVEFNHLWKKEMKTKYIETYKIVKIIQMKTFV